MDAMDAVLSLVGIASLHHCKTRSLVSNDQSSYLPAVYLRALLFGLGLGLGLGLDRRTTSKPATNTMGLLLALLGSLGGLLLVSGASLTAGRFSAGFGGIILSSSVITIGGLCHHLFLHLLLLREAHLEATAHGRYSFVLFGCWGSCSHFWS